MQRIILFIVCLLFSALGAIGCQKTSDNIESSSESEIEQSDVLTQSEEISESEFSENSSDISLGESEDNSFEVDSEESLVSEEKSELVDYSGGGGIVLPDDEW